MTHQPDTYLDTRQAWTYAPHSVRVLLTDGGPSRMRHKCPLSSSDARARPKG